VSAENLATKAQTSGIGSALQSRASNSSDLNARGNCLCLDWPTTRAGKGSLRSSRAANTILLLNTFAVFALGYYSTEAWFTSYRFPLMVCCELRETGSRDETLQITA